MTKATTHSPLDHNEPIAVIGAGCRFPGGASNPSKLWNLLANPRDILVKIPRERFDPDGFYHPDANYHGHSNVRHSYVLGGDGSGGEDDFRAFDADFFSIAAAEATAIDPQQRLLMECVYEALEAGGQVMGRLKGSNTAVYVGLMCEEYSDMQTRDLNMMPTYFPTGTARSVVSNRISYFFDWHGPSMSIDTACSSSLVAVHQAVQVLRAGECRLAIAAGTNLILGPEPYIAESTFHMLSPEGRSKMWDASADGYARGDGVAALVLKRLSDAVADGDNIDFVIRETGVNQDGRTKGITVPSPDAQVELVQRTYAKAGLDLTTAHGRPQYFEAHGTGTLAGDPLEAQAVHRSIASLIANGNQPASKLMVGSVKTVIGHTEGTAGIAGILKAGMAARNAQIPPNLHFKHLNPAIEPFYTHVQVPTKLLDWPPVAAGEPRRASVNSFGFGGTNAHAIIESYDEPERQLPARPGMVKKEGSLVPFVFSANTKSSLKRYLASVVKYLDAVGDEADLGDMAYTLHNRRSTFAFRVAYSGREVGQLRECIALSLAASDWETTAVTRLPAADQPRILGIFTGQGAQWPGMAQELIEGSAFVRARLEALQLALDQLPAEDRPAWLLREELLADKKSSRLSSAVLSQPLCTAVQLLLLDLLKAAGVTFSVVVGHSSGEIACAYAAGVLSARDAMVVAYYRGFHSRHAGGEAGQAGAMLAVGTSPEDAEEICASDAFAGRVCVAAYNSPDSVTLSGDVDAIQDVKVIFDDEGKFARELHVDMAYHSHHMKACGERYLESLQRAGVSARTPPSTNACKWYSSVLDGQLVADNVLKDALSGQYWCDNMTRPVRFSSAVQAAVQDATTSANIALEVGPHGTLKGPAQDCMKSVGKTTDIYASCLTRNKNGCETFCEALGELWKNGADQMLTLDAFDRVLQSQHAEQPQNAGRQRLARGLPSYEWDHDRLFWHESRRSRALRTRSVPGHPLLGSISADSTETDIVWHNVLRVSELPWLRGHALQGQMVYPAAGYVAFAIEAAARVPGFASPQLIELEDLVIGRAIIFPSETSSIETAFALHVDSIAEQAKETVIVASFRAHSTVGAGAALVLNSSGRMRIVFSGESDEEAAPILPARGDAVEGTVSVDDGAFYTELEKLGYQYSGPFRALHDLTRKVGHGRGFLHKPQAAEMHLSEQQLLLHPAMLDAAFQGVFLAFSCPGDGRLWSLHVPVSIRRLTVDAAGCRKNQDRRLAIDSSLGILSAGQTDIVGDLDIFNEVGSQCLVQVQDIRVVPFAGASAANDTQMFFENVNGLLFPDGELAVGDNVAPAEETATGWILERISYFYLRRLVREITPEQEARAAWHHQKLMAYARHILDMVDAGLQPYARAEWKQDTAEALQQLMDTHADWIEVRLMRAVGENLPANVRGETLIIEHMRKDGMLDDYYVESLGLRPFSAFLAEVVSQITHVHPHLQILEIGAGTGGATKSILRKIDAAFDSYCFTDISSGFFETAQRVFAEFKHSDRMTYKVLDAEKDVAAQGFGEHSYDLIVASLVLHATEDLHYTLSNVRRLLRPGGYLVLLEVTSNATMRTSFTMGGLAGWWLGAATGRPWSPCVSAAEWHSLLLESGFTGVETSTPERDILARPFGVLVSRAADERVEALLAPRGKPSALSALSEVVIVTGSSLDAARASRAAAQQLRPHCPVVHFVRSLEDLAAHDLSRRPSVLNLADWAEPVFEKLTAPAFQGLKHLFGHVDTMVWVTRGRCSEQPYANMSVGLVRALMMELPYLRVHMIDFAAGAKMDAGLLVDELLRLAILKCTDDQGEQQQQQQQHSSNNRLLWPRETETVVDALGRRFVARVKRHRRFNDYYNATRRRILVDVDPAKTCVDVDFSNNRLVEHTLFDDRASSPDMVRVRVLYTSNTPLRASSTAPFYPCIGIDTATNGRVFALSPACSSEAIISRQHVVPYVHPDSEASTRLAAVAAHLLATLLFNAVPCAQGHTLVLVEPGKAFARVAHAVAEAHGRTIACVTSKAAGASAPLKILHAHIRRRALVQQLPASVACIIDFGEKPSAPSHLVQRIKDALEGAIQTVHISDIRIPGNTLSSLAHAVEDLDNFLAIPHIVSAADFVAKPSELGTVLDWTATEAVPLTVMPSDTAPVLRGDRTYVLVGLAGNGGLGLSLAEYLVRQGAKRIVLTSRSPNVNAKWIDDYAARGVRVQMIANDVTDESSLRQLIADIRATGPPIAGVAHGAMVLHDTPLETMSYDQMMRVLRPKIDGARYLDNIFHDDALDFFVMFSSLSAVFGNSGQSNYAAANMYMISLAAQRRKRGRVASVVDIGAITGTGYMARNVTANVLAQLVGAGYRKMSEHDFHTTFANAIIAGGVASGESEELISGLHIAAPDEDFSPVWASNARFAHVVHSRGRPGRQAVGGSVVTVPARQYLQQARTHDDVVYLLTGVILAKLQQMLQLSSELAHDHGALLQQATDTLGIDSLVAVEIRTWMMKEIQVDLPVLKILDDTSIQDLVDFAVENLPAELTPMFGQEGTAELPMSFSGNDAVATQNIQQPADTVDDPVPVRASSPPPPPNVDGARGSSRARLADGRPDPGPASSSSTSTDSLRRVGLAASDPETAFSHTSIHDTVGSRSPPVQNPLTTLPKAKRLPHSHSRVTRPNVEKTLPMSFGQSRFWVMHQMLEDPTAMNVTANFQITGNLDSSALERAVRQLGARHEALRTSFANGDPQPEQHILKESPLGLECLPASASPQECFEHLRKHRYDLSRGETMRIALISPSYTQHHLVVGYHHVNMDSTSLAILVDDLRRLYVGKKLPAPQLQFPDFARYQVDQRQHGDWNEHVTYWRREFATSLDPLPILNLSSRSAARPRQTLSKYVNIHVATRLSDKLAAQVRHTSRKVRVTPFVLYTTVLQVLLARLASVDEVCIGMADANRNHPGAMESIGNFLNILPLRLPTGLGRPFSRLAEDTKSKVLAALSHAAVPFEVVLSQIGAQRSSTHSPLFQAFIDYRHVNEKQAFGPAASIEAREYALSKTPYDIMLDIIDTPTAAASLTMMVQESLYSEEEGRLLLQCYLRLLEDFTANCDLSAHDARLWEDGSVADAIKLGQGPFIDIGTASFLSELDVMAGRQPQAVALRDGHGHELSYSQLVSKSHDLAQALLKVRLPRHSRVGVLQQPTVYWVVSMLGVWRAGLVYVPLEMTQGTDRLADIVRHAKLAALVVHNETVDEVTAIGWAAHEYVVDVETMPSGLEATGKLLPRVSSAHEAMVFYTSGSTGTPKGIVIPHRVVTNSLRSFLHQFPLSPQTVLQQTPLSFDVSWWTTLLGLATGGSVVVAAQAARRDPRALTELVVSEGVTLTFAVPSESVSWLQHSDLDRLRASHWTWHFSGGEPYSSNLIDCLRTLRKPDLRAVNVYGPTETMIPTSHEVYYNDLPADDIPSVPIGTVLPNYSVYVVDEQLQPVPAGVSGQLICAGAGIASGYVDNAELSSERFPIDRLARPEFVREGWTQCHLSGDRGYLRQSDGVFVLQARIDGDTQVKLRGLRLDLMDIESHLMAGGKGRIAQAIVHVRKPGDDEDTGSHYLAGHIVLTPSAPADLYRSADAQGAFLTAVVKEMPLPDYMRPSRLVVVDALPLNYHGKIDRRALAGGPLELAAPTSRYSRMPVRSPPTPPAAASSSSSSSLSSSNRVQSVSAGAVNLTPQRALRAGRSTRIQSIWEHVLGEAARSHTLTDDSDFFLVGGNSLLLLRMQGELEKAFDVPVPLVKLFQHSTLGQMTSLLEHGSTNEDTSRVRIPIVNWEDELRVPAAMQSLQGHRKTRISTTSLKVILTGSSGFLGRALLQRLVQAPQVETVYCLAVREPRSLDSVLSPKVIVYQGNLTEPHLGLSSRQTQDIFSAADVVIHNGADTSFMKSFSTLRGVNLTSTKTLAHLSLQHGHTKHFQYISTAGIATHLQRDLYEESLGTPPPVDSDAAEGYVLTKWASEIYLERLHGATGLPLTIHRPTAIVGPSAPRLDLMSNVLHYAEHLRRVPRMRALKGTFQFAPVEGVARDILSSVITTTASSPVDGIQYRNHVGDPADTIDLHGLDTYLETRTRRRGAATSFPVQDDIAWIDAAQEAGMPAEIVSYLRGIEAAYRAGGEKKQWTFPRVWRAGRS